VRELSSVVAVYFPLFRNLDFGFFVFSNHLINSIVFFQEFIMKDEISLGIYNHYWLCSNCSFHIHISIWFSLLYALCFNLLKLFHCWYNYFLYDYRII